MAKTKVKNLSEVQKTETRNIPHVTSGTVEINVYNIPIEGDVKYIVDNTVGGDKNHYIMDYSSVIPTGGNCKAFAMRDGNDLIFVGKIFNGSKIVKTLTTTFEDFYVYSTAKVVRIDNRWADRYEYWYNGATASSRPYIWTGDVLKYDPYTATEYRPYEYQSGYITDVDSDRIAGSTKADTYNLGSNLSDEVYDEAGDDTYHVKGGTDATIYDYSGKDKYNMVNASAGIRDYGGNDVYTSYSESSYSVDDYAGNDIYQVYNGESDTQINDYAGNDKYRVVEDCNGFYVCDTKGNDNYDLSRTQFVTIEDEAGNDKYTITSTYKATSADEDAKAGTTIEDYAGKDTYNLTDVDRFYITDGQNGKKDGGNDTYNLTRVNTTHMETGYSKIIDYTGNDKYNVEYGRKLEIDDYSGNDTYAFASSEYVDLYHNYNASNSNKYIISNGSHDIEMYLVGQNDTFIFSDSQVIDVVKEHKAGAKAGKDTFTITNCSDVDIDMQWSGATKYNVTNTDDISIIDSDGNDTYNFNTVYYDCEIDDYDGNDTYTLTSVKDLVITDSSTTSNDTYKISGDSKVKIIDAGGAKDKLTLLDTNKDNLIFMANYKVSTTEMTVDVNDGALYIFDKTKNNFITLNNFYAYNTDGFGRKTISGYGEGLIENIVAGKKNVNSMVDDYTTGATGDYSNIYLLGQQVANWITANSIDTGTYSSVSDILSNQAMATSFITTFVKNL